MKQQKRKEAQVCFKDWCAKIYDENAELVNGLITITALTLLFSTITKAIKE